jgi:hypothetical protein
LPVFSTDFPQGATLASEGLLVRRKKGKPFQFVFHEVTRQITTNNYNSLLRRSILCPEVRILRMRADVFKVTTELESGS